MADNTGKTAYILYKGGIQGEEPVDIRMAEPLAVRLGGHRLPKGVEEAVVQMQVGEERTVEVPPEKGYGASNPKLVKWYPRSVLDHGYEIKQGSMIMWESADGLAKKPAMVVDSTQDTVQIDMNHPYAGRMLEYWVKLVDLK